MEDEGSPQMRRDSLKQPKVKSESSSVAMRSNPHLSNDLHMRTDVRALTP